MSDIVERLRGWVERFERISPLEKAMLLEAADEIERLTAALKPFANLASKNNWAGTVWETSPTHPVVSCRGGFISRADFEAAARALEGK